jgi:formylglycine-generating enzyme required for sulfatase activity
MSTDPKNPATIVRRTTLLMLGLLIVCSAGRFIYIETQKPRIYAAGQAAASAGQWSEALARFRTLVELDPGYRDAQYQLGQTVQEAVRAIPGGKDVETEIELLRWLVIWGNEARLAEALDGSAIHIPAGEFTMGSETGRDDEHPQRKVFLDAFQIDRYEITNVQYQRFLKATGHEPPPYWSGNEYPLGQADYPVVGMSWPDAEAYCGWAGKRLPTEAEWEKACRGDDSRIYPWGDTWAPNRANIDISAGAFHAASQTEPGSDPWDVAWVLLRASPGRRGPQPIGSYPDGASPYGIMDLAGNASEWVADWYNWNGYWEWPTRNPVGTQPPWNRSLRGSAWYDPNGSLEWVQQQSRCSARNSSHETRDPRTGFRCARSVP